MNSAEIMFCLSPPFPPRTHHWTTPSSSSSPSPNSVLLLNEQAAPAVVSCSSSFLAQHFPTSVLLPEQRYENRPLMHLCKENKTSQMDMASVHEENNTESADQLIHDFRQHLHLWHHLQNLLNSSPIGEVANSSTLQPVNVDLERPADGLKYDTVSLANRASSSSKAASVAEDLKSIKADDDSDSLPFGLADPSLGKTKTVRSTRLLERQSKQRKSLKSKVADKESHLAVKEDAQGKLHGKKNINEGFDQNDLLGLFLRSPETKQLLTPEEESQLIAQTQDLFRLEEWKTRCHSQFGREPSMVEWAEAVGINCRALQTQLHCGNRSREKLIHANLRLVVHIAKNYQGRGLSFQDLLQEGSMGLMKSIEKFKPQAGCRFGSYACWWIRHTIRKAIFHHSRTIRLPEKVYTLLGKVTEAKKLYIREGNLRPTKEELAIRVGITGDRLDKLLSVARTPISMQRTVWTDQDTTFQEITPDTALEIPDVSVSKQLMRHHVHNLLSTLRPKERRIIRLRFGMEDGEQKSLSEVGNIFGLSKERVRQLESRALYKLKQCLVSQGLDAYVDLLA